MRDRLLLEGLEFFGTHGALPEERARPQPFVVDLELRLGLGEAGRTDDLGRTVNYAEVYGAVRQVVEGTRLALLEALAEAIARAVLDRFGPESVRVRVAKPRAPLPGPFRTVAVEIERP